MFLYMPGSGRSGGLYALLTAAAPLPRRSKPSLRLAMMALRCLSRPFTRYEEPVLLSISLLVCSHCFDSLAKTTSGSSSGTTTSKLASRSSRMPSAPSYAQHPYCLYADQSPLLCGQLSRLRLLSAASLSLLLVCLLLVLLILLILLISLSDGPNAPGAAAPWGGPYSGHPAPSPSVESHLSVFQAQVQSALECTYLCTYVGVVLLIHVTS